MGKILLTGGSGFIGSHFHKHLNESDIVNFDLNPPEFKTRSLFIQGDIRVEKDLKSAIENNKITTIISLAAKHHDFGIGHEEYFDTNEAGTQVLCKVASENGIKEIVFYSTVAVYGHSLTATTEATKPLPNNPYGASKLAGENVLTKWAAADPGRKVLVIRPAVVFGSNNFANMFSLIRQIDSGFYFHIGEASNIKSIAFVENLVEATKYLLGKLKPGVNIYNYADEPQLSSRQISNIIAEALGKKIHYTLPLSVAVFAGLPFDLIIKLTKRNLPISTARIKKLNTQTLHLAKKIFDEGFRPKYSTPEGLCKMVEWYRSTQDN